MNSNEIFILIGVFALGFFAGNYSARDIEPKEINTAKTIKNKQIDTSKFLTVDDLDSIYECVDTRIKNQHREIKFPCVSVRGDSI
jgi:hypothetical protein